MTTTVRLLLLLVPLAVGVVAGSAVAHAFARLAGLGVGG